MSHEQKPMIEATECKRIARIKKLLLEVTEALQQTKNEYPSRKFSNLRIKCEKELRRL